MREEEEEGQEKEQIKRVEGGEWRWRGGGMGEILGKITERGR